MYFLNHKRASVPSAFVYHEITEDRGAGGKDFSHLIKNDCHHQIYCCQSHQCIVIIMIIIYHPHLSLPIFSPASAPTFLYPIQTKSQRVKFSLVALCVLLFQKQRTRNYEFTEYSSYILCDVVQNSLCKVQICNEAYATLNGFHMFNSILSIDAFVSQLSASYEYSDFCTKY